jgi:hypothetical protein
MPYAEFFKTQAGPDFDGCTIAEGKKEPPERYMFARLFRLVVDCPAAQLLCVCGPTHPPTSKWRLVTLLTSTLQLLRWISITWVPTLQAGNCKARSCTSEQHCQVDYQWAVVSNKVVDAVGGCWLHSVVSQGSSCGWAGQMQMLRKRG